LLAKLTVNIALNRNVHTTCRLNGEDKDQTHFDTDMVRVLGHGAEIIFPCPSMAPFAEVQVQKVKSFIVYFREPSEFCNYGC
jgi:hypothetical protein